MADDKLNGSSTRVTISRDGVTFLDQSQVVSVSVTPRYATVESRTLGNKDVDTHAEIEAFDISITLEDSTPNIAALVRAIHADQRAGLRGAFSVTKSDLYEQSGTEDRVRYEGVTLTASSDGPTTRGSIKQRTISGTCKASSEIVL